VRSHDYFGIKRTNEVKCSYCPISLVLGNTKANCQRDLEIPLSSDTSNALVFGREVRTLVDTEYELVNNERIQTYKAYVEGVRKQSKRYYEVCAETNTCFVSDYLWTTPMSSTEEANAVTYERQLIAEAEDAVAVAEEQTAQNEDQGHNEPMGSEASCGSDEDQPQTRLNRQPKHLEDFVRLRSAMRMFHRRRASF